MSFLGCLIPIFQNTSNQDTIYDLTYLFIAGFSLFAIFNKRNISYSIYKMFYTFVLFFFAIAPYIQFSNGTILWTKGTPFKNKEYIETNCIIIFIIIVYELLYAFFYRLKGNNNSEVSFTEYVRGYAGIYLLIASIFSIIITLYSKDWDVLSLFFRGGDLVVENEKISSFNNQIITNFFRPMSIIIFMVYYNYNRKWNIYSVIYLLLGLFCNLPSGLARYNAAALYIPFTLIMIPPLKLKYYFNLVFVFGLLVVFPFLNNFRFFNSRDKEIKSLTFNFEMFNGGDFDSYSSFLRIIQNDFVTYGSQLLGVLLFWVPRKIWPDKPVSSGIYLADKLGLNWNNISCNFFAEGYINFGMFGVFLFLFFFAYFSANMDKRYVIEKERSWSNFNKYEIFYLLISSFSIFLLRGDLLSSFAYCIGFISSVQIVKFIMFTKRKSF